MPLFCTTHFIGVNPTFVSTHFAKNVCEYSLRKPGQLALTYLAAKNNA